MSPIRDSLLRKRDLPNEPRHKQHPCAQHKGQEGEWKEHKLDLITGEKQQVSAQDPSDCTRGPKGRDDRAWVDEHVRGRCQQSPNQVVEGKSRMSKAVFDAVAEGHEKEHIAEDVD